MLICISIDCFIMHKYPSISFPQSPAPPITTMVCLYLCWLAVWSAIIHFFISIFFFLYLFPALFLFFLAIASLTASVHTSSGPVPTQTQFPWQQIHPELQVTNHTSACCHLYRPSYRRFIVLVHESLDTQQYLKHRC